MTTTTTTHSPKTSVLRLCTLLDDDEYYADNKQGLKLASNRFYELKHLMMTDPKNLSEWESLTLERIYYMTEDHHRNSNNTILEIEEGVDFKSNRKWRWWTQYPNQRVLTSEYQDCSDHDAHYDEMDADEEE